MKTFLIFLVLLFSCSVFAFDEIYFCSETEAAGLYPRDSGYEKVSFELKKFKIKINTIDQTINSNDLGIYKEKLPTAICQKNFDGKYLSCNTAYGHNFLFNTQQYNFTYASTFGNIDKDLGRDTLKVSIGTCEKF